MAIDVLNALSGYEKKKSPAEELAASQLIEDERTAEALKSLIEQVPTSVIDAGRAPSATIKPAVSDKPASSVKPKVIPKYDPEAEERKSLLKGLSSLEGQVQEALTKGGLSTKGKTTEEISKEAGKSISERPTLAEEQSNIDLLQNKIDDLERQKNQKKQEFESYLDQAIADVAKKPEGMGLMELVGKSMLALAPGLIGAKVAGYRGGQYAAEGSSKALQTLMENEETRRQAAQKIQAEMSKVRASLSKDEIEKISDFQKELIKGQIDLRTLPLKNQLELTRLLSAKELTKDQSLGLAEIALKIQELKLRATEQRPEAKGKAATAGAGFTPGQKRLDEKYAESLNEWTSGGGYAGAMESINRLRQAFEPLKSSDSITGPIIGRLPVEPPTTTRVRQDIEKTIQTELRRILGAQFTEREGAAFLARTFDPKLEESVNLQRVERELARLEQVVALKQQQAEFFQETGSLKNFPLAKKLEELNLQFTTGASATSTGAAVKLTKDLFDKMSPSQRIEYQQSTPARRQEILKSL
jgi:hypothetical protein